jgi:hypothetical protein
VYELVNSDAGVGGVVQGVETLGVSSTSTTTASKSGGSGSLIGKGSGNGASSGWGPQYQIQSRATLANVRRMGPV